LTFVLLKHIGQRFAGTHAAEPDPIICSAGVWAQEWRDPATQSLMRAQVVFEVCIQPETYCVGQSTTPSYHLGLDLDTLIPTSSIEWYTKGNVKGAMHIRALLIRLEPR